MAICSVDSWQLNKSFENISLFFYFFVDLLSVVLFFIVFYFKLLPVCYRMWSLRGEHTRYRKIRKTRRTRKKYIRKKAFIDRLDLISINSQRSQTIIPYTKHTHTQVNRITHSVALSLRVSVLPIDKQIFCPFLLKCALNEILLHTSAEPNDQKKRKQRNKK